MSDVPTPTDPVSAVSTAVGNLANAAQAQIAALAAEAARKNTAAMQANDEASQAAQAHAEFNAMYAAAQKGDANASAWIQKALSGAGLICLFAVCGLLLAVCGGCVDTATIDARTVPAPAAADFSDDGKPDAGFTGKFAPDGSALVTQGLKDSYARLVKKFQDGADPEAGFTKSGTPAKGQPQLYEIRADVAGHYFDLVRAARSGTTPVN